MKQFLLFAVFLLSVSVGVGQCPSFSNTLLRSQADVDEFGANYPNCSEYQDIFIFDSNITDLTPLSNLTSLRKLEIRNNPILENLSGLENLEFIEEYLNIIGNDNLNSINALQNINFSLDADLRIYTNPLIENIDGLVGNDNDRFDVFIFGNGNLMSIQGLTNITNAGVMSIRSNSNLVNLEGLENLAEVTIITISSNPLIQNFNELQNVFIPVGGIDITNNQSLTTIEGFLAPNSTAHLTISDNPLLQSLSGLEGLIRIAFLQGLTINNCDSLINIDELQNVLSIDGNFEISDNLLLENLNGLSNVEDFEATLSLKYFKIIGNPELNNITGVSNFDFNNFDETSDFIIENNDNLSVCEVFSVCDFLMNNTLTSISISNNAAGCNSEQEVEANCIDDIVAFPDQNLLDALITYNPTIDTNGDNFIQFSEAESFTSPLLLSNQNINSISGLEAFINVVEFDFSLNNLQVLNLSGFPQIEILKANQSNIQNLNLSQNSNLTSLEVKNNNILGLDLSSNSSLVSFKSGNINLQNINFKNGENQNITLFEVLNSPNLQFICVDNTEFAEANFTNVPAQVEFTENCSLLSIADDQFLTDNIILFPNPVSETLQIRMPSSLVFQSATVFSIIGEKLLVISEKSVDFSNLSAGVYFVKITTDEGSVTRKIVKD